MWSTLRFLVGRRVLGLLGIGPGFDERDVEIAVFRHQLAILRRQVPDPTTPPPIEPFSRRWPSCSPKTDGRCSW